jgi:ABC-type antimicrobial peptide transport system permease subunit
MNEYLTNDHSISGEPAEPDSSALLLPHRAGRWRRRLSVGGAVLLVLGLAAWISARRGLASAPAVQYTTVKADRGPITAAVAAISLLVGGIGIMNIMLVSVTERTREIGLRMAVGAKTRDILFQFVAESMAVSVVGGMIGVFLGVLTTQLIAHRLGWYIPVRPAVIVVAIGFSALVGIGFGIYPARKASLLDPIEALRYE